MDRINKEKTQIDIFGDIYNLDDIELFYVDGKKLIFLKKDGVKTYNCYDASKCFKEIATEIIINRLEHFVLLLTADNMVNINNIKNISKNDNNLIIETKNHNYTLENAIFVDFMCLRDRLKIKTSDKNLSK